jgi:hypothetical protein
VVWFAAVVAIAALLGLGGPVRAASSLRLPEPPGFGEVDSATLDPDGIPLGPSHVKLERDPAGWVLLQSESAIAGGESVRLSALLEPMPGDGRLRLVEQHSRAVDRDGALLLDMAIDHAARRATCTTPLGRRTLELPQADRVANVPINLLLLPLARGEVERIEFQALLCRGEPRLLDVSARRTGRIVVSAGGGAAVEIEYEVQLGALLAQIARPFLPRILFWIDPAASPDPLVAHQMPLYPKGPTVLVVRRELAPELFLAR